MAKKIGILTYHYSDNYGALLQAFSLQEVLKKNGFEVYIINLIPKPSVKRFLKNLIVARFTKSFKVFREREFNLYPSKPFFYNSIRKAGLSSFDCFIVGSDQVWRQEYTKGLGNSYFLDFADFAVKKIAYAASFGISNYQGNYRDIKVVSKLLKSFNLISVREASGVSICKNLFNLDAELVLDPVFLSPRKLYPSKKNIGSPTKFVCQYLLDVTEEKKHVVNLISKHLDSEVVVNYKKNSGKLSLKGVLFNAKEEVFPEVSSWIYNLKCADFIVTDSYHGLAFSILYNKDFLCVYNDRRGKTRMKSLLTIFNLTHRAIDSSQLSDFSYESLKPIDHLQTKKILSKEKAKSLNLLLNAII